MLDTQTWHWCYRQSEKEASFTELVLTHRVSHLSSQDLQTYNLFLQPRSPSLLGLRVQAVENSRTLWTLCGKYERENKGNVIAMLKTFSIQGLFTWRTLTPQSDQVSCFPVQAELIALSVSAPLSMPLIQMDLVPGSPESTQIQDAQVLYIEQCNNICI